LAEKSSLMRDIQASGKRAAELMCSFLNIAHPFGTFEMARPETTRDLNFHAHLQDRSGLGSGKIDSNPKRGNNCRHWKTTKISSPFSIYGG
jgi:hypothetical protein